MQSERGRGGNKKKREREKKLMYILHRYFPPPTPPTPKVNVSWVGKVPFWFLTHRHLGGNKTIPFFLLFFASAYNFPPPFGDDGTVLRTLISYPFFFLRSSFFQILFLAILRPSSLSWLSVSFHILKPIPRTSSSIPCRQGRHPSPAQDQLLRENPVERSGGGRKEEV